VAGTAALVLLGTLRLLWEGGYRRWASLLLLLPGPLTWGVGYLRGHHMHAWYLVFALPLFAALVALGATSALRFARPPALSRALTIALCAAYLAAMLSWTAAPRSALRTRSVQPYKESVLMTRGTLDPFDPGEANPITVSFSDPPDYYDPRVRVIERTEELRSWLEQADLDGRPLYVNLGRLIRIPERSPELLAMVEREDLFERVASLPGFEPLMSRKIFRYRPGSVALLGPLLISRIERADAGVGAAPGGEPPGSPAGR
jgi:hypothetical protein